MAENRLIYGILIDVLGRPKRKNESKQQFVANVLSTIGSDISQIDDKIIKKLCNGTYIKDSFE